MTVPTETARSGPYLGNGATDTFAYEFRIQQDSDLLVTRLDEAGLETALSLDIDYSVTGVDQPEGGDVVLAAPLPSGDRLVITRDVPATQEVDLQNQGAFFAETIERAFDKLTMLAQQNKEGDARTVTLPVVSQGVSATLPGAVADAVLGWNAAGDALENKVPNTAAYVVAPLAGLTSEEATQLLNIGSTTISAAQWGYLGAMGAQPLEAVKALTGEDGLIPVGMVVNYIAGTPPPGWVFANGQNLLRAQWPVLFSQIGELWGNGDGSTTFGIPDLRGRVVAGLDTMGSGGSANRLSTVLPLSDQNGAAGGSQQHILHFNEMPKHRHRIANTDSVNANLTTNGFMIQHRATGGSSSYLLGGSASEPVVGLTSEAGNSLPHPNVQPTICMNKLVFAGREVPQ